MRRRRFGALLVLLALAGCGSGVVQDWSPPAATATATASAAPALVPGPSVTAPPPAAPSPSPSASALGVVRIPFAGRETELTIVGMPGVLAAWRAATDRDLQGMTWADDDIALDSLTKRELVLAWIGTVCDVKATLVVAQERLVVRPVPREGCDLGRAGRGVVLTFARPIDPASIAVVLEDTVLLSEPTPPPPNAVERWIGAAASRIGLVARVAERSPGDRASMWVDLGARRMLSIVTVPAGSAPSDWAVVSVRRLAGVELRKVRDADGTETEWIVCGPELVWVDGAPPAADATLDAFIERLVPALDCGVGPTNRP